MLKGYLLANIYDLAKRTAANNDWKERSANSGGWQGGGADCFKAWLRSQYAKNIRERKRGARPEDFDRMGTEFHRWLRDASESIGLSKATTSPASSTGILNSTVANICASSKPRGSLAGLEHCALQRSTRFHPSVHVAAGAAEACRRRG